MSRDVVTQHTIDGVTYYKIHAKVCCKGCVNATPGAFSMAIGRERECQTLWHLNKEFGSCNNAIWLTGEKGLSLWTAQRLDETFIFDNSKEVT